MNRGRKQSRAYVQMAKVFKRMVGDVCERTGDTETEIADMLGLGHRTVLNNMTNGHAPLAVDVLIKFTRLYDDHRGIEEALRLAERENPEPQELDVVGGLMRSQRETLEFHSAVLESIRDGELDAAESERIERELNDLVTSAKDLAAQCQALRKGRNARTEVC